MASDFSTILQKLENLANASNNSISSLDVMNIIEEQDGDPDMVDKLFDELEAKGYTFADETLGPVAITTTEVTDPEAVEKLEKMLDMFEENEDVQEVYHNWNG